MQLRNHNPLGIFLLLAAVNDNSAWDILSNVRIENFEFTIGIDLIGEGTFSVVDETFNIFDNEILLRAMERGLELAVLAQWVNWEGAVTPPTPVIRIIPLKFTLELREVYKANVEFKAYYYRDTLRSVGRVYAGSKSEVLRNLARDAGYELYIEGRLKDDSHIEVETRSGSNLHVISDMVKRGVVTPDDDSHYGLLFDNVERRIYLKKVKPSSSYKKLYRVRAGDEVIDFNVTTDFLIVHAFGGSKTTQYKVDLYRKEVSVENYVRYEDSPSRRIARSYHNSDPGKKLFDYYGNQLINASMSIPGDPELYPGDTIRIEIVKPDGDIHWLSGNYFIKRLTHSISPGNFTTSLELVRNLT